MYMKPKDLIKILSSLPEDLEIFALIPRVEDAISEPELVLKTSGGKVIVLIQPYVK